MLDLHHRVTVAPFQKPGTPAAYGLSLAHCEASAWAITPGRKRYPGAAAINVTLAVALGTRLPLRLYAVPGVKQLQEVLYARIMRNRHRLPGDTPHCR